MIGRKEKISLFFVSNAVLLSCVCLMQVTYQTNDDVFMLLFASGAYTGTPSPYLVYIHTLLGGVLSGLYRLTTAVEWYTIVQQTCLFAAFNVLLAFAVRCCQGRMSCYAICLSLVGLFAYFLTIMQFTFTAFALGLASTMLLTLGEHGWTRWISFALFFTAALFRPEAALIPYAVAFPLYFFPVRLRDKMYVNKLLCSIALLATAFALGRVNRFCYQHDPDWAYYDQYNCLRGKINDNPMRNVALCVFRDDEVKKNEYELLKEFDLVDGTILQLSDLQAVVSHIEQTRGRCFVEMASSYYWAYRGLPIKCLLLLFGVLCYVVVRSRQYKTLLPVVAAFGLFFLMNVYLMTFSPPKERVVLPLFISMVCVLLVTMWRLRNAMPCVAQFATACAMVGILVYFINKINGHQKTVAANEEQNQIVEAMIARSGYKKIMYQTYWYTGSAFGLSSSLPGKTTVKTGWTIHSPHTKQWYEGYMTFIDGGLPILIKKDDPPRWNLIMDTLQKKYHAEVDVEVLDEAGGYQLVRLVRKRG